MEKKRHYLVYQITNLINQKIYIGIHSTLNVDDGYMGSGRWIKVAIEQTGIENFNKEILFDFDNVEEMIEKERLLVDRKFIARKDVYNKKLGGIGWLTFDTVTVRDSEGKCFNVHKTDERWQSGELKSAISNVIRCLDQSGKLIGVKKDDPRVISGEFVNILENCVIVTDEFGNCFRTYKDDPKYISGELKQCNIGKSVVKDNFGNYFLLKNDDPRILSGELVGTWKGRKHSEKTKKIMSEKAKIHQKGEGNSQFGSCWIHNESENKKIKKEELEVWLGSGWIKGRRMKF